MYEKVLHYRTFQVVQWLRICLQMQVRSLVEALLIRSHVPQCNILCPVTKNQSSQKYIYKTYFGNVKAINKTLAINLNIAWHLGDWENCSSVILQLKEVPNAFLIRQWFDVDPQGQKIFWNSPHRVKLVLSNK